MVLSSGKAVRKSDSVAPELTVGVHSDFAPPSYQPSFELACWFADIRF